MVQQGFTDVYQIDGGILKYLEETRDDQDNNHWVGDCFVFDYRVAVGKNLSPTDKTVCFACWSVLKPEDLQSPLYTEGKTCPKCHTEQLEKEAKRKALRDVQRLNLIRTRSARSREMKRLHQPPAAAPATNESPHT